MRERLQRGGPIVIPVGTVYGAARLAFDRRCPQCRLLMRTRRRGRGGIIMETGDTWTLLSGGHCPAHGWQNLTGTMELDETPAWMFPDEALGG